MSQANSSGIQHSGLLSRRTLFKAAAAAAGTVTLAQSAFAQTTQYGPDAPPALYPTDDVIVHDPERFTAKIGNTPIKRLHTGMLWTEGPAWNGVGNFLVWSDIPNNVQHRWLNEDGHVSIFRNPSGHSNGNTFDWEGRQISCEHMGRRVVRYEHDGSITVLADTFDGKPFNSPNDAVVHPDGGIWFTDPPYGSWGNYEGIQAEIELKEAVYRIDPVSGEVALVTDEIDKPNGICFSPDFSILYVADTGVGDIKMWDVENDTTLANGDVFSDMTFDGFHVGPDGMQADVDGNLWCSGGWVGEEGNGVHILAPNGERIGQIKLPETTSNLCFGGPRRNRLFMTASQSVYAVYVNTQGAHIS